MSLFAYTHMKVISKVCLLHLPFFMLLSGELVESVGHLKQVKDHDVIECNFHVEVTLSHVSFIDTEGILTVDTPYIYMKIH